MSNALNLEIRTKSGEQPSELIANIFYRWDAITLTSFKRVNEIYEALQKAQHTRVSYPSLMLWVVATLGTKENGVISGITEESMKYLSDNYDQETIDMDLKLATDSGEGLLAVEKKDMQKTMHNTVGQAGVVIIDDDVLLFTHVFDEADSEEDYLDENGKFL